MRFESDPYCRSIETDVVSVATDEHGRYAVLSDTIFYPEGGGQPADRGVLSGVAVIDVQKVDGAIRHYLEAEIEPGPGRGELGHPRRRRER